MKDNYFKKMKENIKQTVNLETFDQDLDEIMMQFYPGIIITGRHREIKKVNLGVRKFIYKDLEREVLLNFIVPYRRLFSYEITGSDRKLIEKNEIEIRNNHMNYN
ncbi:MAG: hypothetical protein QF917_03690 [Candidatus Woesearchaeota archaeon]|jgi:hypothetical protein|nr:hypothetical protein [Candidatus Woesearchaeota archaeon]|tara:strand:+ start:21142 stop:21456 length:315 start_codon:yes stop_codon:yes gene_type:complete